MHLERRCRGGCVQQQLMVSRPSVQRIVGSRQDPSARWQNPHLEQVREETPSV